MSTENKIPSREDAYKMVELLAEFYGSRAAYLRAYDHTKQAHPEWTFEKIVEHLYSYAEAVSVG